MKLISGIGTFKLVCMVGTSLTALAVPSYGQEQNQEEAAEIVQFEEIVVTGTRVRGVAPVGSQVTTLGREEMELSGAVTVDKMLKELPQVYNLGVSESSRGQSGGNGNIVFGNSVNLRGIGPYATLVLIDGHRVVNNSRSIDPSVLPTLGIERIEVVADGASAIYGSDAVAGVVNIIPRRQLDGFEVLGRYGMSDDGDFDEYQLGAAFGKVWDGGQFMIAYEHVYRSNLSGDDRDFFTSDQTASGGNDYRVNRCSPGNIIADGVSYAIPGSGVTQATAGELVAGTSNLCDSNIGQDLIPEQEYDSFNATFTHEINDTIAIFADGFFSKRDFVRKSPYGTATLTIPETNAFFVRPVGFAGDSYTVAYSFKDDLPSDDASGYAKNWQITPGLRISLPHDWRFEGAVSYGENRDLSSQVNGLQRNLTSYLASSDPNVAFDPYGLGRTSAATLAEMANQIFIAPTTMDFIGYEANLDGVLFSLPGGDVNLALGYEGQEMDVGLGLARGNPDTEVSFRDFTRRVDSLYAEMVIPLFGEGNARDGLKELTVNMAVRHDSYDDVGKTTNPKFGINWMPVDGLKVRASYGTSFRAPLISQVYGNSNALFGQNYQNPDGGTPILGFAQSGPNLDLGPETATTWSVGADWDVNDNFNISLTYFDVEYENQVETYLADLAILTREDQFAGSGIILRGDEAAARVIDLLNQGVPLARGAFPGGDPANVELYVDGRNNNLGRSITRGIDFNASYALPTENSGTFLFNLSGTYLTTYKVAINSTADLVDFRNTIFQPLTFKARASILWEMEDYSARILANYVGGYDNTAVTPTEDVDAYTPIDLTFVWHPQDGGFLGKAGEGLSVTFEVQNVFDEDPPYVNLAPSVNGSGGYDATTTNPVGRLFAISARKKF
ncbi:TonB-dependent receptor plug domain-containing protein [Emcibacter sp.]|uniref:TonB-dependent receptor plug domain-containing protein n=1 Tax=Emcibacter sp. TaxID=1979954 RepID=UPI003A90E1CB